MNKNSKPSRLPKSNGTASISRSKSAPSAIKSANIKSSRTKVLTRAPCYEIEEPCEFYLTEIQKRRFISAAIKKSIIDQIKLIKNIGSKIIQTKTKDKSISKQFWNAWNGFQSTLVQEFHHQLTSTKNSIKKLINSLNDYIKFIGNENTQEEVTKLTSQTIEELDQDSEENLNLILADFKDLQSFISSGEVNSKKNKTNFQLTSLLSPILTQLQNLKDIKSSSEKLFSHIDEDTQTFQSLIYNDNTSTPSSRIGQQKPLLIKKSQPVFRMNNRNISLKQNDETSSTTDSESNNQTSIELSQAQEENERLKKQIEEMQKKKSDKRIELEEKRKDEINEIKQLKSTISTLKQKSKQLSSQNTNRNTKSSTMYVPLNPLRSEIRELELEQVKLDAENNFLLEQIESDSNSKSFSNYQKNSQLMQKRSELNKELFELRVKCIQINKVIQKATAKTYETNGNDQEIQKDFAKAQQTNDEMRAKLEKVVSDFNDQKILHEEILANKVKSELQEEGFVQNQENGDENNSTDDDENGQRFSDKNSNLQQQLNNVKRLCRNKQQNLIEEEQKKQIKSARRLRKKTENDLTLLRTNSKSDFDDMMAQAQEVNKQYVDITNQYNEAQQNNKEKVKYDGQILSNEEAKREIEKLISKFTNLNIRINKSNAEEANKENLIMKNEINEIANGNNKLIQSIASVKNKSVEIHSKLQSLHLQHQIFEMKNQDQKYDINNAFDEAIYNTTQQNSVLQEMLDDSIDELNELNIEVPF